MTPYSPGDVVLAHAPGVRESKIRPAVVLSSVSYNELRDDLVLALLTTQLHEDRTPFDHALRDWAVAGLERPSLFRTFVATRPRSEVARLLGHLSKWDWDAVRECVRRALAPLEDGTE